MKSVQIARLDDSYQAQTLLVPRSCLVRRAEEAHTGRVLTALDRAAASERGALAGALQPVLAALTPSTRQREAGTPVGGKILRFCVDKDLKVELNQLLLRYVQPFLIHLLSLLARGIYDPVFLNHLVSF